jgi:hypothetical protein
MCVWVAYTGKRESAPVLWECAKRIEGLWSGYYTGIVSNDGKKLRLAKVAGYSRLWEENYSLSDMPGSAGLWHSRTNSGGDQRKAHPFLGSKGQVALVSQGSAGVFADRGPIHKQMMNRHLRERMFFDSASEPLGNKYCTLENGKQVHCSDFVAQLIEKEFLRTGKHIDALRHALTEYREEADSIVTFLDQPERLYFATTNQRIVAAKYADGIALSITSLAFGNNSPKATELPVNSVGYIDANTLHIEKLSPIYDNIDDTMPDGCVKAMREYLHKNGPSPLAHICDGAIAKLHSGEGIQCRAISTYRALETLYFNGEIELIQQEKQSPANGITGIAYLVKLQD